MALRSPGSLSITHTAPLATLPDAAPPLRNAARVLLMDRDDRILMFSFVDPVSHKLFWITPGGGLDPGESFSDAAIRELREETGLATADPGQPIWQRTLNIHYGHKRFRQHERYFFLRIDRHDVDTAGMLGYEVTDLTSHRWWSLQDIAASTDRFAPRDIVQHVEPLLRGELPGQLIDISDA